MSLKVYAITIDCADPQRLAEFWAEALDHKIEVDNADEVAVVPPDDSWPALLFIRVPEPKTVKNRLHLDLAPDDQAAEVARLKALGATEVDVGQKDVSWVVMADPEGHEFCILTPRKS